MTNGETLYLLLIVAGFSAFAFTLAYQAWKFSKDD